MTRWLSHAGSTDVRDEDDATLLDRARAGDGRAYAQLVGPHLALLYGIARRVAHDGTLAEDAVQETLALAHARLTELRAGTELKSFLAAVAAKQAHTLARAERRRSRRNEQAGPPTPLDGPEDAAGLARLELLLRAATCALSERRREALLLRLDAGLSHREVAALLGTTEGAARVLVHEAMTSVRAHLAAHGVTADNGPSARVKTEARR
ncbi:MAG: RNA polymerase sigma factor [Myxococcales bacterium]|nr:RNA polymerase sigma factor [Myxococcales bacterium]